MAGRTATQPQDAVHLGFGESVLLSGQAFGTVLKYSLPVQFHAFAFLTIVLIACLLHTRAGVAIAVFPCRSGG